jgi:hypothetical protein
MPDPLVIAVAPVVVGAALIERWRRRAVRSYEAAERQARRRRELFASVEGDFEPDGERPEAAA